MHLKGITYSKSLPSSPHNLAVFIDEYQDTSADVLHIFYEAMKGGKGKLYLLGDKMQQIYKTYDGSFEQEFLSLNREMNLQTNYIIK